MDRFERLVTVCMSTPLSVGPNAPYEKGCLWGINLNAIGGSGVGKSKRIRDIGKMLGLPVYSIFSATKTPEHIGGFPVMAPMGFTLECALPQVRAAIDAEHAIIFLDEISSAPPAVQAALLSFVNERTIGEYTLPPGVRIILAMNPADIAANGRDLEVPMANRVLHFNYEPPSLNQWYEFMSGMYDPGVPSAAHSDDKVRSNWSAHFGAVLEVTKMFLESSGGTYKEKDEDGKEVSRSKFYDQPDAEDPRASKAWPSHRTWHMVVNGVVTARALDMDITVQTDIVEGLVGKGIAAEWTAYVKKANLPHPYEVLTKGWAIPKQLDVVRIVLMSCATYAAQEQDPRSKVELGISCMHLLYRAGEAGYWDLVTRPYKTLLHAGFDLFHPDVRVQEATQKVAEPLTEKGHVKYVGRM